MSSGESNLPSQLDNSFRQSETEERRDREETSKRLPGHTELMIKLAFGNYWVQQEQSTGRRLISRMSGRIGLHGQIDLLHQQCRSFGCVQTSSFFTITPEVSASNAFVWLECNSLLRQTLFGRIKRTDRTVQSHQSFASRSQATSKVVFSVDFASLSITTSPTQNEDHRHFLRHLGSRRFGLCLR
jgi:transposase